MANLWRVLPITFGWYLAMVYPKTDDAIALGISLAIGSLGVGVVMVFSYMCGFWDAMSPKDKRPFGQKRSGEKEQ